MESVWMWGSADSSSMPRLVSLGGQGWRQHVRQRLWLFVRGEEAKGWGN